MRMIPISIQQDGCVIVQQPPLYTEEHNGACLAITLNAALADVQNSYLSLSFDVHGLNRKLVSNNVRGDAEDKPAYRQGNILYCPLPSALTSTGELHVQVEAHRVRDGETESIIKSGVFTVQFASSITGCETEIPKSLGLLPQMQSTLEQLRRLEEQLAAGRSPYISNDGFWMQYDDTNQTWVNTGIRAQGTGGDGSGKSPYLNASGIWMQYDDANDVWVSTGVQAAGKDGANGVGVPAGGASGQALVKTAATSHATGWAHVLCSESAMQLRVMTQGAYDALTTYQADTLYLLTD